MKFDNTKTLRSAIVQYSIKNDRELRYVKNEPMRVKVRCQDNSPRELYTYQQSEKSKYQHLQG